MPYEIVKYSPEFKSGIVELQKFLWSPDAALNTAYFEWKYERNPYNAQPCLFLALNSGRVVGMRGMCGARWEIGSSGETFTTLCATDLVIAPDHRSKGLVSKIMKVALNDLAVAGHEYVFSLGAGPVTFVASLADGWRSIGPAGALRRRTNTSRLARKLGSVAKKLPFAWRYEAAITELCSRTGRYRQRFDENMPTGKGKLGQFVSFGPTPRPEAMAELVKRLGSDGRIRHVRDRQFFDWRLRNPLSSYRFFFWEKVRLEGYLVLEQPASPLADRLRVNIADWEGSSLQVRSDLLRAVVKAVAPPEMDVWSATLPAETKSLLQDSGFYPLNEPGRMTRFRPCMLVRPVRDPLPKTDWVYCDRRLLDSNNWDLRLINAI